MCIRKKLYLETFALCYPNDIFPKVGSAATIASFQLQIKSLSSAEMKWARFYKNYQQLG